MYLIDSNLIIYSSQSQFSYLRPVITHPDASVSEITRLETLGFNRLDSRDEIYFQSLFSVIATQPITATIIDKAIELRQQRKMSVGDAIIAATAVLLNVELYTHNTQDFAWISDLTVIDPII